MTKESTFEQLHNKLSSLDLNADNNSTQPSFKQAATFLSSPTVIEASKSDTNVSNVPSEMDTRAINKIVWQPWWKEHLDLCEKFMTHVKNGEYE